MSKRRKWTTIVLASVGFAGLLAATGFAQTSTTDEGKRKVKTRVSPSYPELAKRMSVAGKVKIEVIIAPDGHVKSTQGHRRPSAARADLHRRGQRMEIFPGCGRDDAGRRVRFHRQRQQQLSNERLNAKGIAAAFNAYKGGSFGVEGFGNDDRQETLYRLRLDPVHLGRVVRRQYHRGPARTVCSR